VCGVKYVYVYSRGRFVDDRVVFAQSQGIEAVVVKMKGFVSLENALEIDEKLAFSTQISGALCISLSFSLPTQPNTVQYTVEASRVQGGQKATSNAMVMSLHFFRRSRVLQLRLTPE
jgi:hypothetical protein